MICASMDARLPAKFYHCSVNQCSYLSYSKLYVEVLIIQHDSLSSLCVYGFYLYVYI